MRAARRSVPLYGHIAGAARTAATVLATLLGLLVVTFFIGRVMPTDPVLAIVGDHAPEDVVAEARHSLGLDRPLAVQFALYLEGLARGDLGRSAVTSNPVLEDVARVVPATIELATTAMILATLAGVPLGVLAAVRQNSRIDQVIRLFCLAGQSVPVPVLALVSLLVFYARLGWSPGTGRASIALDGMVPRVTGFLTVDAVLARDWDVLYDALAHLALPGFVLAYISLASIARMTRAFMLEALAGEYIVTARAKGLSAARIIWRHAFGNIAVRLLTVLVLTYAGLLEGTVVTEVVFSWPGLGQYLTASLLNADMNAVLGATLVVGVLYLAMNLVSDVIYRALDPRMR